MFSKESTWKLIDLLLKPEYNNDENVLVNLNYSYEKK